MKETAKTTIPAGDAKIPAQFKTTILLHLENGETVQVTADDPSGKMSNMLSSSKIKRVEIKAFKVEVSDAGSYEFTPNEEV